MDKKRAAGKGAAGGAPLKQRLVVKQSSKGVYEEELFQMIGPRRVCGQVMYGSEQAKYHRGIQLLCNYVLIGANVHYSK